MTLAETILSEYGYVVTAVLVVIATIQWYLGPELDIVERYRGTLFRKLNPIAKQLGRPLVYVSKEDEYICSVHVSIDELEQAIHPVYRRNLTATKKAIRDDSSGLVWSEGSWSHKDSPTAEKQHHVFLFDRGDRVDVYGHYEDNVTDPEEHLDASNQIHGDPNQTLRQTLTKAGVDWYTR
jgi:hypothetical protein